MGDSFMFGGFLLLLAASCARATARSTTLYRGVHEQCLGNKVHTLSYDAVGLDGASFVDLDGDLASHLSSLFCDIDHTRLTLNFHSAALATEWIVKFHDFTDHFIVGGTRWNCTTASKRPGFVLRRVVGASQGPHLSKTLYITTTSAQYDEIFETADIAYASSSVACDAAHPRWAPGGPLSLGDAGLNSGADKRVCLGWNTDCGGAAEQPYPLFQNDKLTVTCSDCWAALQTDVFVNISIGDWKLKALRGGFQNTTLNASAVVNARAAKAWNLALDKSMPIAQTVYLLNFKIGSVPFMLYFDIPMEVTASLEFDTAAEVTLGTAASLPLGDTYVAWDPATHWTHTVPTPDFAHAVAPVLRTTSSASLDMQGTLDVRPTFNMHFDQVFSYSLQATPTANTQAHGSEATKQVCLQATYDLEMVSTAAAHINIDLIDFHKDWNWGPTTVFSKAGNIVPQTCVPL
eukprot:g4215.t1